MAALIISSGALLLLLLPHGAHAGCANACNGHGDCSFGHVCNCYDGWGAVADCSGRNCEKAPSWFDKPFNGTAHAEEGPNASQRAGQRAAAASAPDAEEGEATHPADAAARLLAMRAEERERLSEIRQRLAPAKPGHDHLPSPREGGRPGHVPNTDKKREKQSEVFF